MLYQLYEAQRSMMEPFVDFAHAASKMYSHAQTPVGQTPLAQRLSAGFDLVYRLGKDYEKPTFDIQTVQVDGAEVVIHEAVALDKPFCELRRFKRYTDDPSTLSRMKAQPTVLVVAPLSGHYATLLRDTVRTLLGDHKVYITDWKNARTVPAAEGSFSLDDYVNYVEEFIRHLQGTYGNCHVISVCQPTVPVLAAISLMATRGELTPLSMTMMGGPIDARRSPTAVNNLAMGKSYEWFENNFIYPVPSGFPGAGRRVYPGFLQHTSFVAMNPDRHATSHYDYFRNLIKGDDNSTEAHRRFYDEYNAVLDMDAEYYLDTIRTVFQEFSLVHGTWQVRSPSGQPELVRPQDITTTALLSIEGELDDISGSGQTEAAHALCSGVPADLHQHMEVEGAGHYGIFSGRRWRDVVYPKVRNFIAACSPDLSDEAGLLAADQRQSDAVALPDAVVRRTARARPVKLAHDSAAAKADAATLPAQQGQDAAASAAAAAAAAAAATVASTPPASTAGRGRTRAPATSKRSSGSRTSAGTAASKRAGLNGTGRPAEKT